jgi:hypothetical protein
MFADIHRTIGPMQSIVRTTNVICPAEKDIHSASIRAEVMNDNEENGTPLPVAQPQPAPEGETGQMMTVDASVAASGSVLSRDVHRDVNLSVFSDSCLSSEHDHELHGDRLLSADLHPIT